MRYIDKALVVILMMLVSLSELCAGAYRVRLLDCELTVSDTTCVSIVLPTASPSGFDCNSEKWTLAGWTSSADSVRRYDCPQLLSGTFVPSSDTTLYAVYTMAGNTISASAGVLPTGWTSTATVGVDETWSVKKNEYIVAGPICLTALSKIQFAAKYKGNVAHIKMAVCADAQFADGVDYQCFNAIKGLSSAAYTDVEAVPLKQFERDTMVFIKIYPFFLNQTATTGQLLLRKIVIESKPRYSLAPECSDAPIVPVDVRLINADTIFCSARHTADTPFVFPPAGQVVCTKACKRAGWSFAGWTSLTDTDSLYTSRPQLVDTAHFFFNSDTTLHSVFAYYDYDEVDLSRQKQSVAIGVVTPDGCVVLPTDAPTLTTDNPGMIQGRAVEYISYHRPLISANDTADAMWNLKKKVNKYNFSDGLRMLSHDNDPYSTDFVLSERSFNPNWHLRYNDSAASYNIYSDVDTAYSILYRATTNNFFVDKYSLFSSSASVYQAQLIPVCADTYVHRPYCTTTAHECDTLVLETDGDAYVTDRLTIESRTDTATEIIHHQPIVATDGVVLRIDLDTFSQRAFGIPFDCDIDRVVVASGVDTLVRNTDWYISEARTVSDAAGAVPFVWERADGLQRLSRGTAYRLTIIHPGAKHWVSFTSQQRELVITPHSQTISVEAIDTEVITENISRAGVSADATKGWHLLSTPYIHTYSTGTLLADDDQVAAIALIAPDGSYRQASVTEAIDLRLMAPYLPFALQTTSDQITFSTQRPAVVPALPTLEVVVAGSSGTDKAFIVNSPVQTGDYELGADFAKFINQDRVQIYTHTVPSQTPASHRLFINSIDINLPSTIAMGVYSNQKQTLDIDISDDYDTTFGCIALYDRREGISHDFRDGPFSVQVEKGYNDQRFQLRFASNTTTQVDNTCDSKTEYTLYADKGNIVVSADSGKPFSVVVYDMNGRCVFQSNMVNGAGATTIPLPSHTTYCVVLSGGITYIVYNN